MTRVALDALDTIFQRFVAVPTSAGGAQLEVHTHGFDIEIEVDAEGQRVHDE